MYDLYTSGLSVHRMVRQSKRPESAEPPLLAWLLFQCLQGCDLNSSDMTTGRVSPVNVPPCSSDTSASVSELRTVIENVDASETLRMRC